MTEKPRLIAIIGPTASGKSDLAVALAKTFHGEVISADSRQVYRALDIGTGKITHEEMRGVRHHLLDVASPKRVFTIAQFKHKSDIVIDQILKRGNLPILCGGTGFYVQAVIKGVVLPDVPPNPHLRKVLSTLGATALYMRLREIDPHRAQTIDRENPRRLIRAIEIAESLGHVPKAPHTTPYHTLSIGIDVPMEKLRERIHKRLLARVDQGMVAEVEKLHKDGLSFTRMEDLGLEYRYIARYLQGKIHKTEMLDQLEIEIIHYAKRQYTWFRKEKDIHWIALGDYGAAEKLVKDFLPQQEK